MSDTKPWADDEFDEDKAWNLIKNLRSEVSELKTARSLAASERDEARNTLAARDRDVEELRATVQLTDDAVKARDADLLALNNTRTKEHLLSAAGLPLKFAPQVIGDDENAWQASVNSLVELRGSGIGQAPMPDPAQAASDAPDASGDAQARAFFGL